MNQRIIDPQAVPIVRPRRDEVPWQLLCLKERETEFPEITELMRIAKDGEHVLGGYLLEAPRWKLVRLGVVPEARRQGLGYWLLGHAVGVAESRGATEICIELTEDHPARGLFLRYGFEPVERQRLCFFIYSE